MIQRTLSGVVVAAISVALSIAFGSDARAQEMPKAQVAGELQEIVITATKRTSTVQDTAISVTAISGEDIQDRGIADFTALAQSVPGISMRTSGPGQTEFEMRGMSSSGGNSPTVGFYFDDTPLTAPAAAQNGKVVIDPDLYDLNRVEVLRGPQGTLYGSGSMGGTIKIVPNAPKPAAFDASAQAIFSETDVGSFNHGENAMLNIPLGNGTAALRIVGSESHDSGWIDRVVIADGAFPLETNNNATRGNVLAAPVATDYKRVNSADLTAVRVSMLWEPINQLSITPSFFYQQIRQNGLSNIDSDPGTMAHYQPFDTPEPFVDRFTLWSTNIQYRFDSFDINSTTSRWIRVEDIRQDGAEEFQWAFGLPSLYTSHGGIGPGYPTPLEDDRSKQTTEEVRLTSTTSSNFKWLVGYFYADFESDWNLYLLFPGAAPAFGTGNIYTQVQPTKITQQSLFGEVSYQLTPTLKATAGLRGYSFDSSLTTAVSGAASPTGSDTVANSVSGEKDRGFNPKVDLSYAPSKDLLLYATIAKGFRPGGGNEPIPTSGTLGTTCEQDLQANHGTTSFVPSPLTFGSDSVLSYELGEKMKSLDNRLTVNGAVYFEKWNGVQQSIPLPCGYVYQANAGVAHVYGAEVEINAALLQSVVLSANAGYTHATVVESSREAGITPGTRVQDVPNWTSSVSLAYRHPVSSRLSLTARVENNYVGSRTDATYSINMLPSYDLTNVRGGIEGDQWSAVLFAKNVFNKNALLTDTPQVNINIPTYNRIAVSQPLTIGVDVSYHFGR